MSERPQRHVYINDATHVKYGEINKNQGYCLTCEQFSPCSHNALIDQYEAWENENPRLERLDREALEKFTNTLLVRSDIHPKDWYREIYEKFGQPKDAVNVPTAMALAMGNNNF